MKGWAKVLLGIFAVLLLMCIGGGLWFYSSGAWDQATGFFGETLKLKSSAEGLEKLQKELPFEAPADGLVPEARLEAWLSIRERLRPKAEAFNTWAEAHQGQQGDFQDAREAIGMIGALMGESVAAMRENGMAPAEYRFIEKAMREARREAEAKGGVGPLADEAIVALERLSKDHALDEAKRAQVAAEAAALRAKAQSSSEPLSPNAALYARYAERILSSDLGEFGDSMLQGGGQRHRRGGVEVDTR